MGIISAKGRAGLGIERFEDFIQTDAAINRGNSGGALVDTRGDLVGINTAILSGETGGNQGIGFAIPANLANNIMEQIMSKGKVTRGYMGILPQELTPEMAKAFRRVQYARRRHRASGTEEPRASRRPEGRRRDYRRQRHAGGRRQHLPAASGRLRAQNHRSSESGPQRPERLKSRLLWASSTSKPKTRAKAKTTCPAAARRAL